MALSNKQKETLARYSRDTQEDSQVVVCIGKKLRPTREAGSGIPIYVYLEYLSDHYHDLTTEISRCENEYSAIPKAQEIGRYLRDELKIKTVRVVKR